MASEDDEDLHILRSLSFEELFISSKMFMEMFMFTFLVKEDGLRTHSLKFPS